MLLRRDWSSSAVMVGRQMSRGVLVRRASAESAEGGAEDAVLGVVALESEEGDCDAGEAEGFGEQGYGVVGGEGAEGGEPEGGEAGAAAGDAGGERGEEGGGGEVDGHLEPEDGEVVGVAEEGEAGGEEKGVAGEADEGGADDGVGEAEDLVGDHVVGELAVHEAVV